MKFLNFLFVFLLSFSLIACNEEKPEREISKIVVRKGVLLQLTETETFSKMHDGLYATLAEKGFNTKNLQIDHKYADGDVHKLNDLVQEILVSDYEFIIAAGTPATKAIVDTKTKRPLIYMAISDPNVAGVSMRPNADTTGTVVPVAFVDLLKVVQQLTPNVHNIGLIHYDVEPNARSTMEKAKTYLKSINIHYNEMLVTTSKSAEKVGEALINSGVSAFFIADESLIHKDMPILSELAIEENIPIYCAFDTVAYPGCLASVGVDSVILGAATGDLLAQYLSGKSLKEIPAQVTIPEKDVTINKTVLDTMEINIPKDLNMNVIYVY